MSSVLQTECRDLPYPDAIGRKESGPPVQAAPRMMYAFEAPRQGRYSVGNQQSQDLPFSGTARPPQRGARPSNCAAMVRAWPRQRSLIPNARSLCRRGQRTRAAKRCSRVQRHVSTAVPRDRSLSAPMRFHTDPDNRITETDSRAASESIERSRCSRLCSLGSFRKTAGNGLFCQRVKYA